MAAMTKPRATAQRMNSIEHRFGVFANVVCLAGGLAIASLGFLRPAREGQGADNAAKAVDAATYRTIGIFADSVTGGAANGAVEVDVVSGAFLMKNGGGGDVLARADVGKPCYVIDDQTVGKTNPNATRCVAGAVIDVVAEGVWVDVHPTVSAALTA